MIKADDGDGHTDTVTVEILEEMLEATPPAAPTATQEPPGFEAVFAHFFFLENTFFLKKEPVLRKDIILLVKLFFLRKGLC